MPTWRNQNDNQWAWRLLSFCQSESSSTNHGGYLFYWAGCTNFLTAAGTAHSNRLPVLFLSGDTFPNRLPDPVLQQVEHFQDPSMTVADAFNLVRVLGSHHPQRSSWFPCLKQLQQYGSSDIRSRVHCSASRYSSRGIRLSGSIFEEKIHRSLGHAPIVSASLKLLNFEIC